MRILRNLFSIGVLGAALLAVSAFCAGAGAAEPAKTFQFALQNGLQVVVVPDRRAPVVTQMLWFKVGSVDDPPGMSGMAHLFERMMFRGTRLVPGDGFSQTIARNGGEAGAFTAKDNTVFYERISRDRLRLVMHLEADRMANLDLSDTSVAAGREIVLTGRRLHIDNDARALAEEQTAAALYLSHPYGRPVTGWPDEIRHIGRMDAEDFYKRHFAPNNAILIVAGDVTPDEVRSAVEAEYGQLPARELVARAEYAQAPRLGATRLTIAYKNTNVPLYLRFYRVPGYADAAPGRAEALEVLAKLLGGGKTSVLYRKLVVEKRLATGISAAYDGYARDTGQFAFEASPKPGVALEALERAIDECLASYLRRAPSKVELARAKSLLVSGAGFRRDSPFELASSYGRALAIGLTVYDVQQWPARIKAVTAENVRKAAIAGLADKESVTATLIPLAK